MEILYEDERCKVENEAREDVIKIYFYLWTAESKEIDVSQRDDLIVRRRIELMDKFLITFVKVFPRRFKASLDVNY